MTREQLLSRCKSADEREKLSALIAAVGVEIAEKMVEDWTQGTATKAAAPQQVRYKGARQASPSVSREGDILDAAVDAAGLQPAEADYVYKEWARTSLGRALALVTDYKTAGLDPLAVALHADVAPAAATVKATQPDMFAVVLGSDQARQRRTE